MTTMQKITQILDEKLERVLKQNLTNEGSAPYADIPEVDTLKNMTNTDFGAPLSKEERIRLLLNTADKMKDGGQGTSASTVRNDDGTIDRSDFKSKIASILKIKSGNAASTQGKADSATIVNQEPGGKLPDMIKKISPATQEKTVGPQGKSAANDITLKSNIDGFKGASGA